MNIKEYMKSVGQQAKAASAMLAAASTAQKNAALLAIADCLEASRSELLAANHTDMEKGRENALEAALLDRLALTDERIDTMIEGLHQVAALPDPVGQVSGLDTRPAGFQLGKMRVPLGVVGIIYESRPNVTVEAASLCLKSGNVAILRGGSEAAASNQAIAKCIQVGLAEAGLSSGAVTVVETTDRAAVGELITLSDYVDVIVPRGGKGLIERVSRDATVTVIKHLDGNCHVYIDDSADTEMAINIVMNSKTQRYGTCNTAESLLIAQNRAPDILPKLAQQLEAKQVEMRCCEQSQAIVEASGIACVSANDADWFEEYLGPILAIKVVAGLDEAIEHINFYSSKHTESIVTNDHAHAMRFLREVDSSSVMVNASTRFADGFEYGLGAEIGISTDKIHARGPVGLEGLTCEKYIVLGSGQVRG